MTRSSLHSELVYPQDSTADARAPPLLICTTQILHLSHCFFVLPTYELNSIWPGVGVRISRLSHLLHGLSSHSVGMPTHWRTILHLLQSVQLESRALFPSRSTFPKYTSIRPSSCADLDCPGLAHPEWDPISSGSTSRATRSGSSSSPNEYRKDQYER
ncbi:hypothetical protein F5148DRAFT_1152771 [Russula earlei]|uniref:Uncharacterized protein n=1 Tax=Russula earlei TaxID=71964 RepID=A0ACC0TXM5_9AGAM|nr:hypothetical protein F5148DRAFT_1152771 [Russula earlei]